MVTGHAGLVLHAEVVTLGGKGAEKEQKSTGAKHIQKRERRKFG